LPNDWCKPLVFALKGHYTLAQGAFLKGQALGLSVQ
jgi:hypothetical protein